MCIPLRSLTPLCASHCGVIKTKYRKKTLRCASHRRVRLHGVHHTAESDSTVCYTPWSQAPQCASYHGVKGTNFLKKLCGVHPTAESSSAVCFLPWSQALRCASYRGVKLQGVHHTIESKCTPRTRSQNQNLYESLGAFKGTIRRNPFRGEQFYNIRKDLKKFFFIC